MATQIFINLPVKDLKKSTAFYTQLGYTTDPQFTGETATCIMISDTIYVMLATEDKLKAFTRKEICDPKISSGALLSLSMESKAAVDALIEKAKAAGAAWIDEPEDHGFMYSHSYEDPDGHGWGLFAMTPVAVG